MYHKSKEYLKDIIDAFCDKKSKEVANFVFKMHTENGFPYEMGLEELNMEKDFEAKVFLNLISKLIEHQRLSSIGEGRLEKERIRLAGQYKDRYK